MQSPCPLYPGGGHDRRQCPAMVGDVSEMPVPHREDALEWPDSPINWRQWSSVSVTKVWANAIGEIKMALTVKKVERLGLRPLPAAAWRSRWAFQSSPSNRCIQWALTMTTIIETPNATMAAPATVGKISATVMFLSPASQYPSALPPKQT